MTGNNVGLYKRRRCSNITDADIGSEKGEGIRGLTGTEEVADCVWYFVGRGF